MRIIRVGVLLSYVLSSLLVVSAVFAQPATLDFLPAYYADALIPDHTPLRLVSKGEVSGGGRATFASADRAMQLTIERLGCDRIHCDALYDEMLASRNKTLKSLAGRFNLATATEFEIEWKSGPNRHDVVAMKLPRAVMLWTLTWPAARRFEPEQWSKALFTATNRQRYEDAMLLGSVELGRWSEQIHQHARDLLARGDSGTAVTVLQQVVSWSPYSFQAQLDLAENVRDEAKAHASALAVWQNAESPALTARAARLLGRFEPTWESLPVIESKLRGLQIILIPLQPCDVRLIEETGQLLSQSLQLPVQLARLPNEWRWGAPDRVYRQRDAQSFILQKARRTIDFEHWTLQRYTDELTAVAAKEDALTRFRVATFTKQLETKPGQYLVGPPVMRLFQSISPLRGNDRRTMYVGVTETDVYGGEANFYFSSGWRQGDFGAAILSYARMEASSTNEPYESRKRLIERIAKELVPPALQQLGIPRPVDPADPYSYSDRVERLSQKSLVLSPPTRDSLDKFRDP